MLDFSVIHSSPFYELAILLGLAAVLGFVGSLLRQPMIVSFIAAGVLAGPSGLDLVRYHDNIDLLAELSVAVLLFVVGLKLDFKLIKTLGWVSLATGLGQVLFTSVFGFAIGLALGFDLVTSTYVAVALTFSSTIIIIKLLSDKKEVDSLHGRIAIGFLIVQDLVVVFAMIVLSSLGVGAQTDSHGSDDYFQILSVFGYGLLALLLVLLFIHFLAQRLVARVARSPELLIIFAMSWAVLLAALGHYLGFSKELGGLLAGMSLASTHFRDSIVARLSSLRDFLLLFFFIALGTQLNLQELSAQSLPAIIFSLFVLIGNPLIVLVIMGLMGYRKRTGFLAGLTVAQISEFSLIFMAMGVSLGHVNKESLGLVTLVGLITIALSVYMITYSQALYKFCEPVLCFFEKKNPWREISGSASSQEANFFELVLVGLGRYGGSIANHLHDDGISFLGVDFNPDSVSSWRGRGFNVIYGDACDQEFFSGINLESVKWVVSALPQHDLGLTHEDPRLVLMSALKARGYRGRIAVSAHHESEVGELKKKGADLIFLPFQDAAERAVERLQEANQIGQ